MPHDIDDYQPRGPRERRLSGPRPKRTRAAVRAGDPVVVPKKKAAKTENRKQIERGLNGDTSGSALTRAIGHVAVGCTRRQLAVAREMLFALDRRSAVIFNDAGAAAGVVRMARPCDSFRRAAGEFVPTGDRPGEQLRQLGRHLFEKWPVPGWLAGAWDGDLPDALLVEIRAWHAELNRRRVEEGLGPPRWNSCGIAGFRPKADAGAAEVSSTLPPAWQIAELTTRADLAAEGKALRHCVATYTRSAASGRVAIFSLRRLVEGEHRPRVTIELWPPTRQIVQARGLNNSLPVDDDRKLIETWALVERLKIEPHVFGRIVARRPG